MASLLILAVALLPSVSALALPEPLAANRRVFVTSAASTMAIAPCLVDRGPSFALDDVSPPSPAGSSIAELFDAKSVDWDGPPYRQARYGTSSLSSSGGAPQVDPGTLFYPSWLEGYHSIKYRFVGASFPQGRKVLSLRTPGAGLGTCLAIPNVGYNPKAAHAVRFIRSGDGEVYEDLAYTVPRRLEAFWPESKVVSVRTNGSAGGEMSLSPPCRVTGEGCSQQESPGLHRPSTRVVVEYEGPTRRAGRAVQSIDVTMLRHSSKESEGSFVSAATYSQYSPEQGLQGFYEVFGENRQLEEGRTAGRIRVAAFLPKSEGEATEYEDARAVALYDYSFEMRGIDEAEALKI